MKKVVNITIGGIVFSIEEDAYTALSEYLNAVREHFKRTDEHGEIVDDIELGIAEKFGRKKKNEVIRISDVTSIVAEMGTIEDFKKELSDEGEYEEGSVGSDSGPKKKLYRNVDDQIIAGVASGLAAYFGVDPVFVRLIFILSIFLNGIGILAYLVLWVVMPPAETVSQKLEMQGDPVTLHQFEKMVKDKIPTNAHERTSAFVRVLKVPFELLKGIVNFLARALRNVGPVLRVFFGLLILVTSVGTAVALTFTVTGMHFSVNSGLFELPVQDFLSNSQYLLGLGSVYLLFLIPGAVGAILGWSLLKNESKFSGILIGAFAVIWLGALFSFGHVASTAVPQYQNYLETIPTVEQKHDLEEFDQIAISSGDNIEIREGEEYSIQLSGKEVSVNNRKFEVHDGKLQINNEQKGTVCIGCFNPGVDILVTTPTINAVEAAHSSHVKIDGFETDSFTGVFKHSSRGEIRITARRVDISAAHSSRVTISGSADELEASAAYSSKIDTTDLANKKTSVEVLYSSRADVGDIEVLKATARYSSEVRYDGEPELTDKAEYSSDIRKKF